MIFELFEFELAKFDCGNFKVTGLCRRWIEPTIYRNWFDNANYYTSEVKVNIPMMHQYITRQKCMKSIKFKAWDTANEINETFCCVELGKESK